MTFVRHWPSLTSTQLRIKPTNTNMKSTSTIYKSNKYAAVAGALALTAMGATAQAQSADALIDKLVDKGILTSKEANDLRAETDKDFNKAYSLKSGLPEWVSSLKFNSDFRGRFERNYWDNAALVTRDRYRYRLRFGVTASFYDDFTVGFRLASANQASGIGAGTGGNPVSLNTDIGGGSSKKLVYFDTAFASWNPIHTGDWTVTMTAGKMDNPFALSNMVFDYDITPEGAALQGGYTINDKQAIKFNSAFFVLGEISKATGPYLSPSHDPFMLGAQALWESKWTPKVESAFGVAAFAVSGKSNLALGTSQPNFSNGNTRSAAGYLLNNYTPIVASGAVTYKLASFPGYEGQFPLKLSGEYLKNPGASANNQGYFAGIQLGKAGHKGLWEIFYRYQRLDGDAWYESFPDDDNGAFYSSAAIPGSAKVYSNAGGFFGGTNIKGHLVKATYNFTDYLNMSMTFYLNDLINRPLAGAGALAAAGNTSGAGHFMVDMMWKF